MGFGYKQNQSDHTLFIKHLKEVKIIILLVYIDDIIVTRSDKNEGKRLKAN